MPKPETHLNTAANLSDADGFYAALLAAHDGLSPEESTSYNARLILLLANQIGDQTILSEALEAAKAKER